MKKCYKNAITNELFLSLSSQLALVHTALCADAGAGARAACADADRFYEMAERSGGWLVQSEWKIPVRNATLFVNFPSCSESGTFWARV